MAPFVALSARENATELADTRGRASLSLNGVIVEAWAEGYQVGSLVILILLVICNYRRHVPLHKLIVLEMVLALWHGTFIFFPDPVYGWYLSSTATLLFISYNLHNVIAYLKIRVFLPRWGRWVFIISLALVQPFWVVESWDNFEYFNEGSIINTYTRPWEALFRDPWWIFTLVWLLYQISSRYQFTMLALLKTSPRFGVMILCMILSIIFLTIDTIVTARSMFADSGVNPFWRLTLVFKCAADTIFLDDFKSVLDKIVDQRFNKIRRASCMPSGEMRAVIRSGSGPPPKRESSSCKRRPSLFDRPRRTSHDDGEMMSPRAGGFHHVENAMPGTPASPPAENHRGFFEKRMPSDQGSENSRFPLNPLPSAEHAPERYF